VFYYVFMCLRGKVIPEMTCTASAEASNPTHSLIQTYSMLDWFGPQLITSTGTRGLLI